MFNNLISSVGLWVGFVCSCYQQKCLVSSCRCFFSPDNRLYNMSPLRSTDSHFYQFGKQIEIHTVMRGASSSPSSSSIECEETVFEAKDYFDIYFFLLHLKHFLPLPGQIECKVLGCDSDLIYIPLSAFSSPPFPPLLVCWSSSEKSFAWRSAGMISSF